MRDPRHHLGRLGERLALEHLRRLGYELIARNHRTRFGELDLVMRDSDALVFVEVKTRRAAVPGRAWENLHPAKRRQVRRMAAAWLAEHGAAVGQSPGACARGWARDLRFDAVGVTIDAQGRLVAIEHLEGAF